MENYKIPDIKTEQLKEDANIHIKSIDELYGKVIETANNLPKEGYLSEIKNHKEDNLFQEEMDNLFKELRQMNEKLDEFKKGLDQLHKEESTTENDNLIRIQNKTINHLVDKIENKEKEIELKNLNHEKDFEEKMENIAKYN